MTSGRDSVWEQWTRTRRSSFLMHIMTLEETSSTQRTTSKCKHCSIGYYYSSISSQDETSEEFVGEWMNKRGIRDQIVIATKVDFSSSILTSYVCIKRDLLGVLHSIRPTLKGDKTISRSRQTTLETTSKACESAWMPGKFGQVLMYSSQSSPIFIYSLKKLRTNYIDILYVHWWDWTTSIEEVMDGLHNLVLAGKVLYLVGALSFGARNLMLKVSR